IPGSTGDTVLTQSSASLSVSPGQRTSISCRASQSVNAYGIGIMHWYQQKPEGKTFKILIYETSNLQSGISWEFSGSGLRMDYSLIIRTLEPKDFATIYCQHISSYP
ncbi:Ig kappa chain V-III region MOPC 63, partial [Heterocephalus glaber]